MGEGVDPGSSGIFFGGTYYPAAIAAYINFGSSSTSVSCAATDADLANVARNGGYEGLLGYARVLGRTGDLRPGPPCFLAEKLAAKLREFGVNATAMSVSTYGALADTSQNDLAKALIASGQLQLPASAFATPEAQAALAAALTPRQQLAPGAAPMTSPSMFGISGFAPAPSMPLSFLGGLPTFDPAMSGGSILGTLGNAAINIGSAYLAQQLAAKQAEEAFKRQRDLLLLQSQLGLGLGQQQQPQVIVGANGQITVGQTQMNAQVGLVDMGQVQGPVWTQVPGGAGSPCGGGTVTLNPMDSPGLYRLQCSGQVTPRSRFYALRANGTRDLFVRVGTVNSVSPRTLTKFARRWAKQAKLTLGSRRRGGRRRPR